MNNRNIINYFKKQEYITKLISCDSCPLSKTKFTIVFDKNDGIEEFYNLNCIKRLEFFCEKLKTKIEVSKSAIFCNQLKPAINDLIRYAKSKNSYHLKTE